MRLQEFYQRVTEGLAVGELWAQFKADTRSSYTFYSRDVDWGRLQGLPAWRRALKIAGALFWAMLMHLTPPRRIILLVAVALLILGVPNVKWETAQAEGAAAWRISVDNSTLLIYGALCLLFLLALELMDRVVMKRDLQIAREIQRWLVPSEPPAIPGLDLAFSTRPANTVGGDFYDVIVRRSSDGVGVDRVLLVVADVAGKSVPAALLMATFQASLHALADGAESLADLAARMNRSACSRSMGGQRFTTAFFAELEPASGSLRFVNAGHNYPYLRRADGHIEELVTGGLPLGIQAEAGYKTEDLELGSGDLLLIYTDGLVEAVNPQDEEFGDERLRQLVLNSGAASAAACHQSILREVDGHVGQARQYDDMTWLILRVC